MKHEIPPFLLCLCCGEKCEIIDMNMNTKYTSGAIEKDSTQNQR